MDVPDATGRAHVTQPLSPGDIAGWPQAAPSGLQGAASAALSTEGRCAGVPPAPTARRDAPRGPLIRHDKTLPNFCPFRLGIMTVQPLDYLSAIRDDRELSSSEKLIALMVMSHAGADGRNSHPGYRLLAEETGLDVKTIKRLAPKLVEKKWLILTYSGRGGNQAKANAYDLNIPGDAMKASQRDMDDSQRDMKASQRDTMPPTDALDLNALRTDAVPMNAYRATPQAQPSASPEATPKGSARPLTQPQGQDRPGPSPAAQSLDQPPGLEYIIGEVDRAGDTWTPSRNPTPGRRGDGSSRWETLRATPASPYPAGLRQRRGGEPRPHPGLVRAVPPGQRQGSAG